MVKLRYHLRASKVIPSPLPPHRQPCSNPSSCRHALLRPHPLLIFTPFPGPTQLVSGLTDGFVKLGKPSNHGDLPSIPLASCELGLHDSSSPYLLLLFENGGDQLADAPSFVPTPQASRPYIPLVIRLHVYSPSVEPTLISLPHVARWHTFATYI